MNPERDESLTADNFNPGKRVSVDHFESRLLGRTFALYGKTSSDQYKGGCIFLTTDLDIFTCSTKRDFQQSRQYRQSRTSRKWHLNMALSFSPSVPTAARPRQMLRGPYSE